MDHLELTILWKIERRGQGIAPLTIDGFDTETIQRVLKELARKGLITVWPVKGDFGPLRDEVQPGGITDKGRHLLESAVE